jgi:hypothetical protein
MIEILITGTGASWLNAQGQLIDLLAESKRGIKIKVTAVGARSLSQNRLMWSWYGEIANQIQEKGKGEFSSDDLHEYFKDEFCPQKQLKFGSKTKIVKSTTRLDTGEMTRYLNQIHHWCSGAGFKLTIPDDCEYAENMRKQDE